MNITKNNNLEKGFSLPLMEAFHSIQGEGFFSGKSSYFLRIGGCDVGCPVSYTHLTLPTICSV